MLCPKCKKEIKEKNNFCKYCGLKIELKKEKEISDVLEKRRENIKNFLLKNKYVAGLFLLIIIYLILRFKYLFIESIWPDEALYLWYGYEIFKNPLSIFSTELWRFHPPLFPIIVSFFNVFFDKDLAARLVTIFFGLAGIILIYYLGNELKSKLIGLLSAIMLTLNHVYWFLSNRILLDVPLTTFFLASVYFIIKFDRTKTKKDLILAIFFILATLMTKRVGVMIIPFILFYYSYRLSENSNKKGIKVFIGIMLFLFILTIIVYYSNFRLFDINTRAILKISNISSIYHMGVVYLLTWPILTSTLVGIGFFIVHRERYGYILLFYIISVIGFRVLIGSFGDVRLILPSLPPLLLFASAGIFELCELIASLTKLKIYKWILIILAVLISIPALVQGNVLNKSKTYSYTGFKEAGEFLKNNLGSDSIIMASSGRQIRAFSEFDYKENNGVIEWDYLINDKSKFEYVVKNNKNVFLELDIWEYTQPAWIYPLDENKMKYLNSLDFELIKIIERNYPTQEGYKKIPVIFIFRKTN